MPEGDTIHNAARRVGAALVGRPIENIETPQPRHALDRWPERLEGRAVRSVDAHGKHLFLRFEGDLTLHSHLRMGGAWGVYRRGQRWRRSPRRAWLVIRTPDHEVVQFDGPVLELMTDARTRFDRRLANLGPDVLAEELDEAAFLRRLRGDDQTRGIGDALLDQRNLAGIGNLWKAEACFLAGVSPWKPVGELSDERLVQIVEGIRPLMRASADGGFQQRDPWVFERTGRPCRRCGTTIRARGQGDDNRTSYWCPTCQT
jgi:endonuclease VIII